MTNKKKITGKTAGKKDMGFLNFSWIRKEFYQLHTEHGLILKAIKELKDGGLVTPGLEKQVRRASGLATRIDRQVPDEKKGGK